MEELFNFAVTVGSGSGCLFKTHSTEYMYVLTAKHNIDLVNEIIILRKFIDEHGQLKTIKLDILEPPFLHPDSHKDAAIVKVHYIEDIKHVIRIDEIVYNGDFYNLAGYPSNRNSRVFPFRTDRLILMNKQIHGYIEGQIENNPTFEEIVGYSGGGIFKIDGDNIYLLGIQKRMSNDDNLEMLGRVEFMPLSFFDEIVSLYFHDLRPISQAFELSFIHLKNQIAKLDGCLIDAHVSYTREFLQSMTDNIVASNLTPMYISNFFSERLLVFNSEKNVLQEKGLWIAWLEFLIIMNIIKDNPVNNDDLEDLFNNYRLLFSSTTSDWSTELKNIIQSDYRGLSSDAKVIVGTNSVPKIKIISVDVVDDIIYSYPVQRGQLQIDDAKGHPLKKYKLIHLYAFQHDCIISKHNEYKHYSSFNEDQLLEKLKDEYERLFK